MKSIQKILVFTVLYLISFQSNASTSNFENETLVTRMSNDDNVIRLFKSTIKLSLIKGIKQEGKPFSADSEEKIASLEKENIELSKIVNTTYPEFLVLSTDDKHNVTQGILKSPVLVTYWECIGQKTAVFASILGIGVAGTAAYSYFTTCTYSIILANIIGIIISGGSATAVIAASTLPQAELCAFLASVTVIVGLTDVTSYIAALFTC